MADVNVRSDAVDVEEIMRQIRARIREKRGVDYTEAELQQLARVKLETFLDPRGVRSDLLDEFRARRTAEPALSNFEFGEDTLYETHRGALRAVRRLLRPVLKLFFNPDRLTSALHVQSNLNAYLLRLEQREPLVYELIHNLTVEVTRLGIDVQNLKMRVESLSSRLDFAARRARALESVVQYRPPAGPAAAAAGPAAAAPADGASPQSVRQSPPPGPGADQTAGGERRRRRRRRRRRPGQTMADAQAGGWARAGDNQDQPASESGSSPAAPDDADEYPEAPDGSPDSDGPGDPDDRDQ